MSIPSASNLSSDDEFSNSASSDQMEHLNDEDLKVY